MRALRFVNDIWFLLLNYAPHAGVRAYLKGIAKYVQLAFAGLGSRMPDYEPMKPETEFGERSVWYYFSLELRFVLKNIRVRDYLKSPVIVKTTSGVAHMPEKEIDKNRPAYEHIKRVASILNAYYSEHSIRKWENWLSQYQFTNERLLSQAGIDQAVHRSLSSLEIGSGIGVNSLVEAVQVNRGVVNVNYDLPEMLLVQRNIKDALVEQIQEPGLFENIRYVSNLPSLRTAIEGIDYKILTYWAFTEFQLEEREKFIPVFKGAKYAIIVANQQFEGMDNFSYIKKLAEETGKRVYEQSVENPANMGYVDRHRAFLLI